MIGENCWIGARTFICPGVELGEGCVVAGGSVVTRSFPPCSVVGGNPAKLLKIKNVEMYELAKRNMKFVNLVEKLCKICHNGVPLNCNGGMTNK